MKTFKITFIGREAGAIGICYRIEKTVQAADAKAARLKLYETHEHITIIRFETLEQTQ